MCTRDTLKTFLGFSSSSIRDSRKLLVFGEQFCKSRKENSSDSSSPLTEAISRLWGGQLEVDINTWWRCDQTIISRKIFSKCRRKWCDFILISAAMFLECCSELSFVLKNKSTKIVQNCQKYQPNCFKYFKERKIIRFDFYSNCIIF